jgi:hypothetical protein
LASNPATPAPLLFRLLEEYPRETTTTVTWRWEWSDEQARAFAAHPDTNVRALLAGAIHATPEQRARLVDDRSPGVLAALADGPDLIRWGPPLPTWAYERLWARSFFFRDELRQNCRVWPLVRGLLAPAEPVDESAAQGPLSRAEAEGRASDENPWTRVRIAVDPRLPADLVAALAVDPEPNVRLAVSMRPDLSEEERAAIDYHVGPEDRLAPVPWAAETTDAEVLHRCVHSRHIGLRRSAAENPHLPPHLVAVLATDDDFAVRLLLCENHADVPGDLVLATYLEARTISRGWLLKHPRLAEAGLARLADSPDPNARKLVRLDPLARPEVIERLSHDPCWWVRAAMAPDRRLSPGRVLELLDDPTTTEGAAANPHLPVSIMERFLADAHVLREEVIVGAPALYLGNWTPAEVDRIERQS